MPEAGNGECVKMKGIEIIRGHRWEIVGKLKGQLRLASCYYSVFKCTKCGIGLEVYVDAGSTNNTRWYGYVDANANNTRWYCGADGHGWKMGELEKMGEFECQKRVMVQALR